MIFRRHLRELERRVSALEAALRSRGLEPDPHPEWTERPLASEAPPPAPTRVVDLGELE